MATASVLREIASVNTFFASRDMSGDVSGLQRSFADGLLQKLKLIKDFGASEGAQIFEALKGCQFGESQTQRIRDAIDAMLQKHATAPTETTGAVNQGGRFSKQLLKCWWHYFTQTELDMLMGTHSLNSKMTLMVERAMSVGCTQPAEQTYKWCLAMLLLCHYRQVPKPQEIYEKLQDLKKSWSCEATAWYLDHIEEFPDMPVHLPRQIFEHAYAKEQPVAAKFAGINTVAESIPLRKNSKLLKATKNRAEIEALDAAFAEAHTHTSESSKPAKPVKQEPAATAKVKDEPVCIDVDDDPEIVVLKKEYELKLAKLRAGNKPSLVKHEPTDRLVVHRQPDGSLQLRPRLTAKEELPPDTTEPKTAVPLAPTEADLDPWAQAAVVALEARHEAKNAAARKSSAASKKRAAAAESSEADVPEVACKRPASSMNKATKEIASVKKEPKKELKKQPKKEQKKSPNTEPKKEPDDEVPKSKIMQSMPKLPSDGSSPKPVKYWGGIIYTAAKAKKFRALKVRGDAYTEASASWGGDKPSKAAWVKCVKAIDDHHKK